MKTPGPGTVLRAELAALIAGARTVADLDDLRMRVIRCPEGIGDLARAYAARRRALVGAAETLAALDTAVSSGLAAVIETGGVS